MISGHLKGKISSALNHLYQVQAEPNKIAIELTSTDFKGDYTFVVFPYLKASKKSPEITATEIGNYLKDEMTEVAHFNVVKGFLNLELSAEFWLSFLQDHASDKEFGRIQNPRPEHILLEYSSPNTNKPLHLGHIRNNLLGYSIAQILKANGHLVKTCNLVNDRGIHICKSMVAWLQKGNGETPTTAGLKGDHLVGKYYVLFDQMYKAEQKKLIAEGMTEADAEKAAPSIQAAQQMLQKWEAGDEETLHIWKKMNGWVYEGFETTYQRLGVQFDKFYYESDTYLLGKEIVAEGLAKQVFFQKPDGSVWIDLTEDGLDQKLLLRGDGTSVYITQDIGTAELKFQDFHCERSVYVVGNEQEYHFKVLQLICKKLGKSYADGIFHLSYGMVELPEGKMKSREGTVVDADDLMNEMETTAEETTKALGKTEGLEEEELTRLYKTLGMGALKYFILKVDPKKKMMFNPQESIDFHGNTGPFIQYTYARIKSVLRNSNEEIHHFFSQNVKLSEFEKGLIAKLYLYPSAVAEAGKDMSPAVICNYAFELARAFNLFYHEHSILKEENPDQRALRLQMCQLTAHTVQSAFQLLGIDVPERM